MIGAPTSDLADLEQIRARRERALATFVVCAPPAAFLGALVLCGLGLRPSRVDLVVFAAGAWLTMVGIEVGYHRYFTHRSFEAPRAFAWLLGALGSSAFLGPVIWWATIHRRHHAHTDGEGDPHSPHWPYRGVRGLWHAHTGWLFDPSFTAMALPAGKVRDLWANPVAVGTQRLYLLWGALGLAVPTTLGALWGGARGAVTGALWGGFARVFVVSHLVWAINSLGHRFGAPARLDHAGRATNSLVLALPTVGGGFHGNHHDAPRLYTTSRVWWQLDGGAVVLWLLARAGVVSNLRRRAARDNEGRNEP